MIKPINRDTFFLSRKALPATEADLPIARDLRDTLAAHRAECVGMAANMIGSDKRIIIVSLGVMDLVMLNPVIIKKTDRRAQNDPLPDHQGPLPGRADETPHAGILRMDGADHPA